MNALRKQRRRKLAVIAVLSLLVLLCAPFLGMSYISPFDLFNPETDPTTLDIFRRLRFPRVLLAYITGAALALCGMVFQALFRNPLATPYTLGVSSGASLGAVLFLAAGAGFSVLGISGISLAAFCGALLSIVGVFLITKSRGGFSSAVMLLAGVSLSFFFSSLILFMQYLSDFNGSIRIIRWLMGSLQTVGGNAVYQLLPFIIPSGALIFHHSRQLNLLAVDEEFAVSRGVDIRIGKPLLFFATSLAVGGVVSQCGPIGFVGMIVPHICRLIIGPDHRYLTPAVLLFGGMFLTLCDLLSRTLIAPAEIPVGVITALLGGPFFLWLLVRDPHRQNQSGD